MKVNVDKCKVVHGRDSIGYKYTAVYMDSLKKPHLKKIWELFLQKPES